MATPTTPPVDQSNLNTGVGGLDDSQTLYLSATDTTTTEAAKDKLNQEKPRFLPSSQRKGGSGYEVEEVPDSCCQKVGNCFKGFFSSSKKTHNE